MAGVSLPGLKLPGVTCNCATLRQPSLGVMGVKRPDGSLYETEFARCYHCAAMYHFPGALPPFIPSGGAPETYGAVSGSGPNPQLPPEQYADIMSAAARARKSRKRR